MRKPVVKLVTARKAPQNWLKNALPLFKTGIRKLNIDDICAYLCVSKATFYKAYNSKDEFVAAVVSDCLHSLFEKNQELVNRDIDFCDRYLNFMFLTLELSQSITAKLMADIKLMYPESFAKISRFMQSCDENFIQFYREGVEHKILETYDPMFIAALNRTMFNEFTHPEFLLSNNLTFQQACCNLIRMNVDAHFSGNHPKAAEIKARLIQRMAQLTVE